MLIKIKFEFIGSFKKDLIIFQPEIFEENGIKYVKKLKYLDSSSNTLVLNNFMVQDPEALKKVLDNYEKPFVLPDYLALKDLRGYLQSIYPSAKITEESENNLN